MTNTEEKKLPRGLRNCNPLNLRRSHDLWQGLREEQTDPEFFQFKTMAWGYRAAFVVIRTYVWKWKLTTLVDIVSRWAPDADGNDSELYLARVRALTGMGKYDTINPLSQEQMIPLVEAMSRIENGQRAKPQEVQEGWLLYMG
ncbi:MAG: hypothetical protein LUC86_00030 [Prevotellaceae bacterium]|nr:hypothetical protein [Prevotellaceae bacterium]